MDENIEIWKEIDNYIESLVLSNLNNEKTYIYGLVDPDSNIIRYIGKADKPIIRFRRHLKDKKSTHKTCWIKSLLSKNKFPKLIIIEEVCKENWKQKEIYYIKEYKEKNNLTNTADGGLGGGNKFWKGKNRSLETCLKISNALTGRILSKSHAEKSKKAAINASKNRNRECFNTIGEKNSKVTKENVIFIRNFYEKNKKWGSITSLQNELAIKFNVNPRTIRSIVNKEVWTHI